MTNMVATKMKTMAGMMGGIMMETEVRGQVSEVRR